LVVIFAFSGDGIALISGARVFVITRVDCTSASRYHVRIIKAFSSFTSVCWFAINTDRNFLYAFALIDLVYDDTSFLHLIASSCLALFVEFRSDSPLDAVVVSFAHFEAGIAFDKGMIADSGVDIARILGADGSIIARGSWTIAQDISVNIFGASSGLSVTSISWRASCHAFIAWNAV
jgi:hypothetical protein